MYHTVGQLSHYIPCSISSHTKVLIEQGLCTYDYLSPYFRGPLWDNNLTWYTDNPDFTICFQLTVLTYLPTLILLIGKAAKSFFGGANDLSTYYFAVRQL